MKLSQLLEVIPDAKISGVQDEIDISGIFYDRLRMTKNSIYVAINIYTQLDKIELPDGHPYVWEAIERGAVCVVLQRDIVCPPEIVKIIVPDSRVALSLLSDKFYGSPSKSFKLIGVTGTNGKTTTTHILEQILSIYHNFGLIGSLYYKINGRISHSKDTTPEPPDLQAIFREMAESQVNYCALEASSHGIDFHRLDNLDFAAGIFTNLTPDHLDYHITMKNYRDAKLKFFSGLSKNAIAVVNMDDSFANYFINGTSAKLLKTGLQPAADIYAANIHYEISRTIFELHTLVGTIPVCSPLVGEFNVYNVLSATAAAIGLGVPLDVIKKGLEKPLTISGRFEKVDCGQSFGVIVDYAHTPDSMKNVLITAKQLQPNRLITVFGCGGNRDKTKRPLMGEIACKYSDRVILTSDNPRYEDPFDIIRDIQSGIAAGSYTVEIDRKSAIIRAIEMAKPGDMVMILGKGHEKYQEINGTTISFNDYAIAEAAILSLIK